MQLELELLEDRRLLSAGLTAALTGGILTITGGDDSDDVTIDVSGNELRVFNHDIEVSIDGAPGGDHHVLDLSELTGIDVNLGAGDDSLAIDLAAGISVQVQGSDDSVALEAPAPGTAGSLTIDAASVHIAAGTYASLQVELTGEIQTLGEVDWTASGFAGHGPLTLSGSLSLHADETQGFVSWEGGIDDGGLGASLLADGWSDITLDGVTITGGLEFSAASVTLNGDYLASSVGISADDLTIESASTIEADSVELHPFASGSTLRIGAEDDGDGLGVTAATLDQFDTAEIILGGTNTDQIIVSEEMSHASDATIRLEAAHGIAFETGSSWETIDGDLTLTVHDLSPDTDQFSGIRLDGATLTSSGGAKIALDFEADGVSNGTQVGIHLLNGAVVSSVGTGDIDLLGVWAGASGAVGVLVEGTGTRITSVQADISIAGQGGGGPQAYGVVLQGGAEVRLDDNGAGGGGGVSTVATAPLGRVSLLGIGDAGGNSADVQIDSSSVVVTGVTGTSPPAIYVAGATLRLVDAILAAGGGAIVVETSSVLSADPLEVSDGLFTVNSSYEGDIEVGSGGILGGNGTITGSVTVASGGTLAPGNSPDTIFTGDLTLVSGANFDVEVTGALAGQYDKVVVTGTVDVTGAILNLDDQWAGGAVTGDALLLIDNDGGDAVTGTFSGLANGTAIAFNGETWRIYYNGGDGNDVVLVYVPPAVMDVYVNDDFIGFNNGQIVDRDPATAGIQQGVIGIDAFATITAGVNAVAATGTVHVAEGVYTYTGTLILNKAMTLDGAGMTATEIRRTGAPASNFDVALQIDADNVTISDVRLGWTDSTTNDYMGYVVVVESLNQGVNPIIDNATITRVMFGEGYRSAVVMEGTDGLEVSDSIFEGNWGRAAIRDGTGGSGTNFLITRNEFREDHFRWGPISLGPQDNGDATNAYSGVISFNYFGNGLDPLNFQEQGDRNYTIAITNNGVTGTGLVIDHNTFDWNDSNETNANGVYARPAGVHIDPTVTSNTNLIQITDNIFNNYGYTGPQPGAQQPGWTTDSVFGTGALDFDGADDYATFMDPDFDVGNEGTLSFWVKMDNTGKRNQFFEGPGDGGMEFQYRTNSGGQFYGRMDAGLPSDFAIQNGGAAAGASNNWTNVQYTWNFTTKQLHVYVNGVETYASGADSNISNWTQVVETVNRVIYVGRDPGDNTRYFDGTMDDIGWFNRELNSAELAQIRNTAGAGVAALSGDASLVAHWDLDTTSGFTEADNKNGIVLTVHTSTPTNDGPQLRPGMGVNGTGALEFDGIDDYATFQDASFNVGEQGTLSVWVKFNDLTSRNTLVEGTNSVGMEFAYRENSNGQFFGSPTRSTNDVAADNPNNLAISSGGYGQYTDQWVNIQYTWDRNGGVNPEMHIYINGTQVAYASATFDSAMQLWNDTLNTTTETMYVGRDSASTDRNFGGLMDDMAWYSEMLNQSQLDNVRLNGPGAYTTNLVAHWNFDDPVGTTNLAGDSGTSITLHLQSDPPPPPPPAIYGYGVFTPANTVVTNNVFYNDVPGSSYLDSNQPLDASNITGASANPFFNGDQPGYTGTTLAEYYALRFGSSAAFESSEFQTNIATSTPHVGAYQDDPVAFGTEDILVAGTDNDDLLVITFTSENDGYFSYTRNVTGGTPDYVGTFNFTDVNSFTFDGYGGDDVLIIYQPTGSLYNLPGGIVFNGGTQNNNGNALDSDGATGSDTLVLLASPDVAAIDSSAYVFLNASPTDGHNGSITLTEGALSTVITFTNVGPIRDELSVDDRSFAFNATTGGGGETVDLTAPGDHLAMTAAFFGADPIKPAVTSRTLDNRLASNLAPTVSFANPNRSLAINSGLGDDVVNVTSVDAAYAASLSIDGAAGSDIIVVTTDLNLGSMTSPGELTFTAERIDIGADITTTGQQTYNGPIVLTDSVVLMLAGSDTASIDLDSVDGNGLDLTISSTGSVLASGLIDLSDGLNPAGDLSVTFDADGDSVNTTDLAAITAKKVTMTTGGGCDDTLTLGGAVDATADVSLTSIGTINVNAPVSTTTGNVTFQACNDILFAAVADVTTNGGFLTITAGRDVTSATGADFSTVADDGGNVTITAGQNIALAGDVIADGIGPISGVAGDVSIQTLAGTIALMNVSVLGTPTGASGNVAIQSQGAGNGVTLNGRISTTSGGFVRVDSAGNIVDGSADHTADITTTSLLLRAATGIGSGGAGDAGDLDLVVAAGSTTMDLAAVTGSGDINLHVTGSVTITDVAGTTIGAGAIAGHGGVTIGAAAVNADDDITLSVTNAVTINRAIENRNGGDIAITAGTIAASSDPADVLTVAANIAATAGDGTITLSGHRIVQNAAAATSTEGTGAVSYTAYRDISLTTGTSITTLDGGITLQANTAAAATGAFVGIALDGAAIATGDGTHRGGNILLEGRGGTTGVQNVGVAVTNGASIRSRGQDTLLGEAGTVTIRGFGGATGTDENHGVFLGTLSTGLSAVSSVDGNITIEGTAGGTGANNDGVRMLTGATVASTGTTGGVRTAATLTITGTGGTGTTGNRGVIITNAGTAVTSVDGNISLTGQAGGTGVNGHGVVISAGADVRSSGAASIGITGTSSAASTSGGGGNGVRMEGNSTVQVTTGGTGTITITGRDGTGANDAAVLIDASTVRTDTTLISITGVNQDVSMTNAGAVRSNLGDARIRSARNVLLGIVNLDDDGATTAGAGTAYITADADTSLLAGGLVSDGIGEITDNLAGEASNVTASAAVFRAGSGIGNFAYLLSGDEVDDIDVEVGTLAAITGTGELFISDASDVTVAALDGLTNGLQISGGLGDLLVRAAGNMTIDSAVLVQSPLGSLTLAAGVSGPAGTLDVNANVASTAGDTRLVARDGVNLNGAAQVGLAGQDVEIHAGRVFQYSETLASGTAGANLTLATDAQVVSRYAILTATGDVSISRVSSIFTTYVIADSDQSGLGAIVDSRTSDGVGNVNITATNASLRAGSGIGTTDALDLTVSTVAAESDSGSIRLDNTTSLTSGIVLQGFVSLDLTPGTYGRSASGDVASLSGITIRDAIGTGVDPQDAATGAIVVQATGSITVSSAILNADAGDIALDANGAGVTLSAAVTSQNDAGTLTGTVRISADGSVTQSAAGVIRAVNLGVRTTGGQIDLLVAQNDVDNLAAETLGAGADIGFRDADGFQLSLVTALVDTAFAPDSAIYAATSGLTADGDTIRLVSDGTAGTAAANSITQDGVNGPITAAALGIRVTGGDVLLDPNPATSINDVDTLAILVTPSAGLGGNVDFADSDDLTIGTVLSGGHGNFADTSGIATQVETIDVRTINGTMTVAQGVSTTGAGTVRLDANGTNSDLVVQATITTASGAIALEADDSVTFAAAGDVTSVSGTVTVTANADAAAADGALSGSGLTTDEIFMADDAVIDAGSGRIVFSTAGTGGGHITIGQLITTNAGTLTPAVRITSQQQVRDGGDTGGEDIIAAAGRLVIDAQSGVGNSTVAGATAAIETRVASLDLQNHVSGNVDLLETDGINVIRIAQQQDIGAEDGTAFTTLRTTTGSIVAVDVADGGLGVSARDGQVTLEAIAAEGDILLFSGITTKGGSVHLEAGSNVWTMAAGDDITTTDDAGTVGASGSVVILAHAGSPGNEASVILHGDVITSGAADQDAGNITITVDDGQIAVASLLARGGSTGAGGAAGNVSLFANDLGNDNEHRITLNRQIVARAGGASLAHGQVQIVSDGLIVDNDETSLDIDAGTVRLVAVTGLIGLGSPNQALEIDADTLAATTVTGNLVICDEAGGLTIGLVAGTDGVTVTGAGGGKIVIDVEGAGNALVVNSLVSTVGTSAAAATIDLSATGITLATAAADITAVAGEITLDANLGQFASFAGAVVTSPAIVRISADTIDLQGTVHSDSQIRLAADTASTAINLGTGANGAGGFALDEVELNNIESPIVRIGTAGADTVELCDGTSVPLWAGPTTGAITFTGAFASDGLFGTNFLELFTRSSVTAIAGGVDLSAATTDLVIRAGADVNLANDAHNLQTVAVVTNNNAGGTLTNSAITLRDTAGMTIGTVDGLSGLTTAGGAISVTTLGAAADLQVEQAVSNTGSNAVSLEAGRHINFTAAGDVTTQGGPVTVTADAFSLANTGGAITMADGTVIQGATANVTLTADGDVRLGQILTGGTTGNVTVTTTSGAIRDNTAAEAVANSAASANIVGNIVTLSSVTGIGNGAATLDDAADIDIDAESLSAVNTLTGAIQIFETDSVALRDLSPIDTVSNVGRAIIIDAGTAITDFTPGVDTQANITGGAVTLRAVTGIGSADDLDTDIGQLTAVNTAFGNIQVSEIDLPGSNGLELLAISNQSGSIVVQTLDGPLTVSGPVSTTGSGLIDLKAGDADASAGETLLVNSSLVTQSGRITLTAEGGDVRLSAVGNVTSTSGDVTILASAAVDQQSGSIINAGTGLITIVGGTDVTLARLVTANATDAAVAVTAAAGGIIKAAGSVENIAAGSGLVTLTATSGIGSAAAIGLDAARLRVTNTSAGDVRIAETNNVDVQGISQFGPGLIDLSAGGTVVITAGATVQSANGSITMQASGAIDMQDSSLVDAGTGRITVVAASDVGLSLVRTAGDGVTTGVASITSTFGQIRDNDLTGAPDVQAASLAMTAAGGIGNGNPVETSVTNLAALAQSGSLLVTNSTGGGALNITSVAGISGLTNNDTAGGNIVITHAGSINVNAPVQSSALYGASPEQGVVRLSTATAFDGDITINSWISAPRARLDIAATGDVAFNDSLSAVDVLAASVQAAAGTADAVGSTAHGITVAPNTVIASSTGAVNDVIPRLDNFTASQVTALGVARIDFDYGRSPDEVSFTLIVTWGDGTQEIVQLPGGQPGHATFEHTYTGNPNVGNPAAPIPVTVTVLNDDNITFLVAGEEVDINTQTRENAVPGDGLQTSIVYDLSIVVPELETPRSAVTDALQTGVQTLAQVATTVELAAALDAKATVEGRVLIVHQIGPDGKPLTDAEGNPLQMVFTQEETQLFLGNLAQLYRQLNSGKFRIYLQEGDGRPLLVSVVTLRSGVPVTGNEATLDRPPTADADMGAENGKDPELDGPIPPPPPLPTMSRAEKDGDPLVRSGQPSRGLLAMVGNYLKNLGLM